ncbi:MAG: triose-phosphate isomerase [Anaerolineales bacterium]|nr:triose-phosphate isomerase [Anaerolineales bacterium]
MKIPLIAGNWKMHNSVSQSTQLVDALIPRLNVIEGVEKLLIPSHTALYSVSQMIKGTDISLGAQGMYWEEKGAYTGQISPAMVKELCSYVLIGHSECRQYFGETDQTVNKKVTAALAHQLVPILCVGENLPQYESGQTAPVIRGQLRDGLRGISLSHPGQLVIAYEPVWAIGTGRSSSVNDLHSVVSRVIRPALASLFGDDLGVQIRLLYGGSVNPQNASDYLSLPQVDGALVGGASLDAEKFIAIAQSAL